MLRGESALLRLLLLAENLCSRVEKIPVIKPSTPMDKETISG